MARNRQLSQVVELVRAEIGDSSKPSVGVDAQANLKALIRRWQEWLYDEYDWPFLQVRPFIQLNADQRFYDIPRTGLDAITFVENVREIVVYHNNEPKPVFRGIGPEHYASRDPEIPETQDPVLRWDIQFTGTREQLEFWPVPGTSYKAQIFGRRELPQPIKDEDRVLLDDIVVALHTAADILSRQKNPASKDRRDAAVARVWKLRARSVEGRAPVNPVHGASDMDRRYGTHGVEILEVD